MKTRDLKNALAELCHEHLELRWRDIVDVKMVDPGAHNSRIQIIFEPSDDDIVAANLGDNYEFDVIYKEKSTDEEAEKGSDEDSNEADFVDNSGYSADNSDDFTRATASTEVDFRRDSTDNSGDF